MKCPQCKTNFNDNQYLPLILPECGDTVCAFCISQLINNNTIVCPICKKETRKIDTIFSLPKNMLIIKVIKDPSINDDKSEDDICTVHKKSLEAFCETEQCLLCVNCILLNDHKSHKVLPITDSSNKALIQVRTH